MCSDCAWDSAVDTADEILELLEELPDEAASFGISIEEKVSQIRAWVSEHEHATDKQVNALDNMHRGVLKWLDE